MSKKIKTQKELPKWFFEKDYNIPSTCRDWADALNARLHISLYLKSFSHEDAKDNLDFFLNNKHAVSITKPLYEYVDVEGSIDDLSIFETIALSTFIWKPSYDVLKSAIKNAINSAEEYFSKENTNSPLLGETRNKHIENWVGQSISDSIEEESDYDIFYDSALERYNKAHYLLKDNTLLSGRPITVDLGFDDKTIINDFSNWLKEQREDSEKILKKPFTDKDFNDWKRYKVLEVFDLDLWSEFYGIKITDAAMAKALWPDSDSDAEEIDPVDRLRKTSRSKVKELINPLSVRKISAQAGVEITALDNLDDEKVE